MVRTRFYLGRQITSVYTKFTAMEVLYIEAPFMSSTFIMVKYCTVLYKILNEINVNCHLSNKLERSRISIQIKTNESNLDNNYSLTAINHY